jgi:hypothetical protein
MQKPVLRHKNFSSQHHLISNYFLRLATVAGSLHRISFARVPLPEAGPHFICTPVFGGGRFPIRFSMTGINAGIRINGRFLCINVLPRPSLHAASVMICLPHPRWLLRGRDILALYLMGVGSLAKRLRRVTDSSYPAKRRGSLVRQLYLRRHCSRRRPPSNVMLSTWERTDTVG